MPPHRTAAPRPHRRSLEKALALPEQNELDLILPSKGGQLEVAKLPAPSRVVLYTLDQASTLALSPSLSAPPVTTPHPRPPHLPPWPPPQVPMVVDTSGKGDLFPTVHALWLLPGLLPQIFIKHAAVSQYIIGGADLMLPGVAVPPEGLPRLPKGALVSICVRGNPAPVAVGALPGAWTACPAHLRLLSNGGRQPPGRCAPN
jgi:translation initiation factor 2D